jgi:hypothetical protein
VKLFSESGESQNSHGENEKCIGPRNVCKDNKGLMFQVCKSVQHHTNQINHPTRCNNASSLLLDVYVQLNMFRALSRPSSGAQQMQ